MVPLNYTTFHTGAGWVGILGSTKGLRRITLPQRSSREALLRLGDTMEATRSARAFRGLVRRLSRYFEGERVMFPDRLDMSPGTAFQRRVWAAARLIPFGETRSYGWIAGQIKRPGAARAAGQALGRNPFPVIVPCHRVLAGNGRLGGFSGGLEMKRLLLSQEGAAEH